MSWEKVSTEQVEESPWWEEFYFLQKIADTLNNQILCGLIEELECIYEGVQADNGGAEQFKEQLVEVLLKNDQ